MGYDLEREGLDEPTTLGDLTRLVASFRDERDWAQFHNPKDLAVSITIEAAELLEIFQWKSPADVTSHLAGGGSDRVREEVADIVIYCLSMSDALGFDLSEAIQAKLAANAEKYPVEKSRGNAKKYTELER